VPEAGVPGSKALMPGGLAAPGGSGVAAVAEVGPVDASV